MSRYEDAKAALIAKFREQDEQIKFLEWVWADLIGDHDYYINNNQGELPNKYKI